tara:strand:+ start:112 stop:1080 length:969 start_codon:yes stop_codon:yes gene_type:complete
MQIGNLKIKNPVVLAPMAGITDYPFRIICKNYGVGIVYTEFVSANGIIRENQKTLDMIKFSLSERPIGVQIFGEEPKVLGESAKFIYDNFKPDIIDINYGCPVPKVTKKGAGSAALKDICKMEDSTRAVIESVPEIPITVKMRAGWDKDNIISTKAGMMLESIGIKAIALHARTSKQMYTGKADWNLIRELKEAVKIPVIGNGDVNDLDSYKKIREETNCDGVMIGRGALGRPWIFKEIANYNENLPFKSPDLEETINTSIKHIDLLISSKHPKVAINLSKKHLAYYFKGFKSASSYRKNIMRFEDVNQIKDYLDTLKNNLI